MNIIFILMILSLLISQSLMDLMSFIVIIASLWAFKKQQLIHGQKILFHRLGLEKLWLVWIGVFVLGLALAPIHPKELLISANPWLHRLISVTELKWIINFYFFIWFFEWLSPWEEKNLFANPSRRPSWTWIWFGLLAFSIYGLVGWIFNMDLIKQQPLSDPGRVGGLFDDPMTFAHVYGLFFILVFFVTFQKMIEKPKELLTSKNSLLLSAAAFFSGLAILLSMTRGVWIGVFVALLISFMLYRRNYGLWFFGLTLTGVTLLSLAWPRFLDRLLYAFDSSGYDSERFWLWKANWKIFLDHPLLGIGYGAYKWKLRDYYDLLGAPANQFESHAHNQYLHFLAGTGIFGLLCFLFFVGFNLVQSYKLLRLSENSPLKGLAYGLFGGQICFLVAALTESNFERAKVRWTYLIFAALAFALSKRLKSRKPMDFIN